ncbi:MAG: SpoIIE family protein phosphatase [Magnetococcales bacterium]|nr:SpoIIE family protein phosphatase [Magnetococcales bacterium]
MTAVIITHPANSQGPFCGDQLAHWQEKGRHFFFAADGLGHGKEAEAAALSAREFVENGLDSPLEKLFDGCNQHIRNTRGVAMGIAIFDPQAETVTFAGVGNISMLILRSNRSANRFSSDPGIVGGGYRRVRPETIPFLRGDLLVLHTDGVKERMNILAYRRPLLDDLKRLGIQILEDWSRRHDDTGILLYRFDADLQPEEDGSNGD